MSNQSKMLAPDEQILINQGVLRTKRTLWRFGVNPVKMKINGADRWIMSKEEAIIPLNRKMPSVWAKMKFITIRQWLEYVLKSQDSRFGGVVINRHPDLVYDFLFPIGLEPKLSFQHRVMIEIIKKVLRPLQIHGESEFELRRVISHISFSGRLLHQPSSRSDHRNQRKPAREKYS